MKRIGQMLKTWRQKQDLTIRQMAGTLKISTATLSRLERGEHLDTRTLRCVMIWMFEE